MNNKEDKYNNWKSNYNSKRKTNNHQQSIQINNRRNNWMDKNYPIIRKTIGKIKLPSRSMLAIAYNHKVTSIPNHIYHPKTN